MVAKETEFDPQTIGPTVMRCMQEAFGEMSSVTFSKDPDFSEKEVIEYESRMRVFGMEKFNGLCYIAVINFYLSAQDLKNHDTEGALVLFVEYECAGKLLKALGYENVDDEDEEIILDNCGEFCKVIAGKFKNEMGALGFKNLTMSDPLIYKNDIPEGIEFKYSEYSFFECNFYLWKQKAMVLDVTLAPVPPTS